MPKFGKTSRERLQTCDERLQEILNEAISVLDFSVLCGHRGEEEQQKAFSSGHSKARWGQSKHNTSPSLAVDIAPYPIDWENTERFAELAGLIKGIAHMKGITITWGGDFKSIKDMPHFEIS